jgi:hypothetical protein
MFKTRVHGLFLRDGPTAHEGGPKTAGWDPPGRLAELREGVPPSVSDDDFEYQLDELDRAFASTVFPSQREDEPEWRPLRAWDEESLRVGEPAPGAVAAPVSASDPDVAETAELVVAPEAAPVETFTAGPAVALADVAPPPIAEAEILAPAVPLSAVSIRSRLAAHRALLAESFRAILAAEQAARDAAGLPPVSEPRRLTSSHDTLVWTAPRPSSTTSQLKVQPRTGTTARPIATRFEESN